jgi:hypothetical protein
VTEALCRVEEELESISEEVEALASAVRDVPDDWWERPIAFLLKAGMASTVEKIYSGLEKCLVFIARDVDGLPIDSIAGWHKAVLLRMRAPHGDVRPAVLSPELFQHLNDLRAFRHRERNTYGSGLDMTPISDFVGSVSETISLFTKAIGELSAELDRREEQKRLEQERQAQETADDQAEDPQPKPP